MVNPARAIMKQFVRRSPMTLLAFGIIASLVDFGLLYMAAVKEGVLYITQGVGLLNNYGLLSTLIGNAVFPYLAKKYYNGVCSIRESKAVVDIMPVGESLSTLTDITKIEREYRFSIYLMIIIGALAWVANVSYHVIGNPQVKWGHKVFDSTDHPLTFWASRLHNFYTWLVVLPLLAHVIVYSSVQLWRAIARASHAGVLAYDLLNPDRRGGFAFVDKVAVAFNVVVALVYVQIMLHVGTFKMNPEHIIIIVLLTLAAVFINRMFLGGIYATIKTLRLEALNKMKDKVYKDDKMSFEILKYCYEQRVSVSSIVNFAINPGAIVVSGVLKLLWPVIAKALS
jgi:hypothetical protein